MRAELIPVDGGDPIPITRDVTVVGRREYCDIQIDHSSLSKRHCLIVKTEGLLVIRDLATTNGTKVKGQKIRWAALLPDDKISLGSIKFRVFLGPDEPAVPATMVPKKAEAQAAPRPHAGVASAATVKISSPVGAPAPHQHPAKPAARPILDEDLAAMNLDVRAWGDVLGPDSSEIPEVIDLD